MSFSVTVQDLPGVVNAVNYLLSGPTSLGQDLAGFNSYFPAYLTGNFRVPFALSTVIKSATGKASEDTIIVSPTADGLYIGMTVTGPGIGVGAVLSVIGTTDNNGTTVTLSAFNTDDLSAPITFSPPLLFPLYVAPIALSTSELLDPYTNKFTFASAQAAPPFAPGAGITVAGVTPSDYDGTYTPIGVVECTTTYVIARTQTAYVIANGTGGTVSISQTGRYDPVYPGYDNSYFISTDANARSVVSGGQQRVFVSAQLNNVISYTASTSSDLRYTVAVNRYVGFNASTTNTPDFRFVFDTTLSQKSYSYTGLTGTGTLANVEAIFTAEIDTPPPGFYWYILEVSFYVTNTGDLEVTQSELGQRSLSALVLKP